MNKRYAIIENGIVVNIIVATENPSYMTNMICIEINDTVQVNYIYDGKNFIEVAVEENDIVEQQ